MSKLFLDKTSHVLNKVLDGTSARQRVLAENIANAETPGYLRKELSFEGKLREAMSESQADPDDQISMIDDVALAAARDTRTPARDNGNNVEIEREMTEMAKNSLQYETAAQLLSMKLRAMRNAIHEGRR